MRLTETKCRNAHRKEKTYKLSDGRCLYLVIPTKGNKRWEFRYQFMKKPNTLSFGPYPEISLEEAREKREEARKLRAKGLDPSQEKKKIKLQKVEDRRNTFESVATAWFDFQKDEWGEKHKKKVTHILGKKLYPRIGKMPIKEITPNILLETLHSIIDPETGKNQYTATQAKQIAGQVWRYAVIEGIAEIDITPILKGRLKSPKTIHRPALLDPIEIGKLMLDIDAYKGTYIVCSALRFLPLTFVRPGELRHAEWKEINWEKAIWTIDKRKMKNRKNDHIVPLSRQAMEILYDIHKHTGNCKYIFAGTRKQEKPISDGTINKALRKLGYKGRMVGHGWRSSASTLINEESDTEGHLIEHQLAHSLTHPLGQTYNRAEYLPNRGVMMQDWADYLDERKAEAKAKANTG